MMNERARMAVSLFDFLEASNTTYCVVGDTRRYPQTIASDIDIVVPRHALAGMPRLLAQFCRAHDARMVQMIRHEACAYYFVLAWSGETGEPCFLAPDICSDYRRGGRKLLSAEEILGQRAPAPGGPECRGSFYVPPPHIQFIYYLLKKVGKGRLDPEHGEYLSEQWHADPSCAWTEICRFWPASADADLIAGAAAYEHWSEVNSALPRLRRALHRAAPLAWRDVLGELRRGIERLRHPTGLVLAVLGPDGSGKSSVTEHVLADLAPAFRRTAYYHLRPRIFAWGKSVPRVITNPHALVERGKLASFAKLMLFLLDDFAGYLLQVRPLTVRSTLVAFDRYYHDLLVDPRRYRYGGSMRLARWVGACIPGPDLWVLLDAPAAILQARKAEVAFDEAERQRLAYLKLVNRWNADVVDASLALAPVVAQVEVAVLRFLEQRLEERNPELRSAENPLSSRLLLRFCRRNVPILSRLFRIAFNCDIYCRIRAPFILPHPFGVIIHSRALIGSRVTVMQQVTIGTKNPGDNAAPVIEDDVYIGAGAKVLGGIRVGRGAVIGANAVVTRDVPAGCTVVGANRIVGMAGRVPGTTVQGVRLAAGAGEPSREPMRA